MTKHKDDNFCAYHSFGNLLSCIAAVKWDAYDVENTYSKQCKTMPFGPLEFIPLSSW